MPLSTSRVLAKDWTASSGIGAGLPSHCSMKAASFITNESR